MSAFDLAWKEGADGVEGDFWLSKDGKIVCIHDADTMRTAGVKHVTAETDWSVLKKLDAGSWKGPQFDGEPIPLLSEILDSLPAGKMFFVEIKCGPEIVPALAKLLKEKKADPARVIVISFNDKVISASREQIPGFQAHLISSLKEFDEGENEKKYTDQIAACDAQGLQFQADASITGSWLMSQRKRGLKLTAWVIDDAATVEKMSGFDLDFMTTNRPAALREILAMQPVLAN